MISSDVLFFCSRSNEERTNPAHLENTMLLGEYRQAINKIGQLALPDEVLSELKGALVVTRGFEGNLILYPAQEWQKLADKLVAKPISNHDVRTLRRRLFSDAAEMSVDDNGRILLPSSLRKFAGINGEVILAGMYDHIELWSVERWSQTLESIQADSAGDQWNELGV